MDISITAGRTATLTISTTLGAEAYSLAGIQQFTFAAKIAASDTSSVIVKQLGDGLVVTDAANGLATLTINPVDTESLAAGNYLWELALKDSTDQIFPLGSGTLFVAAPIADITSPALRRSIANGDTGASLWADAGTVAVSIGLADGDSLTMSDSGAFVTQSGVWLGDSGSGLWLDAALVSFGVVSGDTGASLWSDAGSVALA